MTGAKKYYVAAVLAVWLNIVVFFTFFSRMLNLEVFFILSLIGLLMIAVLNDGASSHSRYMRYINYLIVVGVTIFVCIVAGKILEILVA